MFLWFLLVKPVVACASLRIFGATGELSRDDVWGRSAVSAEVVTFRDYFILATDLRNHSGLAHG